MWYVYMYLRENRTPYYVGKGISRRCYKKHFRGGGNFTPPKDRIIILKYFDNQEDSYIFEDWLIKLYGRKSEGGILINMREGGGKNGNILTEEEKELKKIKQREYQREYYKNNPEKQKSYREKRKEERKKTEKEWYKNNREKYLENRRKKYDKEKKREYYLKNKEEIDRKNMQRYWKRKN
jgi:hypothetical protein